MLCGREVACTYEVGVCTTCDVVLRIYQVYFVCRPNVKKSVLPTMIPGDAINAKLVKIGADGAKVLLASGFHAFIQNIHLTEVPLKNPEKKLKVGQTLPCKVSEDYFQEFVNFMKIDFITF